MLQFLKYLWALPTTILGITLFSLAGGKILGVKYGILFWEPSWGFWKYWAKSWSGITFGHTVLIRKDLYPLSLTVAHEQIHVEQCEKWGILWLPAYLFSSLIAYFKHEHIYRGNIFEKEAYNQQRANFDKMKRTMA